ncbi:MAG: peptidoglycan D,D-transpeptidase FtsI family protein, partial [Dehalococcoidia bacterium]
HFETTDSSLFVDPAVSTPFEPGSTFKIITMASGLETHTVTPDTTMVDTGSDLIGGQTIWDWDHKAHGTVTMVDVLAHSLNLGAAFVGRKVGANDLYRFVRKSGFGQSTGVDLQGESSGIVRYPEAGNWYPIDLSTNSFGQGLTTTSLQLTAAIGSVANGGAMMRPYVVQKVVRNGKIEETQPVMTGHPMSPQTAQTLTDMMVKVIRQGEGNAALIPGYVVAGKTGTASIAEHGVYLKDATIASFIGFVPAQNPAFVIYIKIDRPKDTPWGSETAAPLFRTIARELLLYLHVEPTEPMPTATPTPLPTTTAAKYTDQSVAATTVAIQPTAVASTNRPGVVSSRNAARTVGATAVTPTAPRLPVREHATPPPRGR